MSMNRPYETVGLEELTKGEQSQGLGEPSSRAGPSSGVLSSSKGNKRGGREMMLPETPGVARPHPGPFMNVTQLIRTP